VAVLYEHVELKLNRLWASHGNKSRGWVDSPHRKLGQRVRFGADATSAPTGVVISILQSAADHPGV